MIAKRGKVHTAAHPQAQGMAVTVSSPGIAWGRAAFLPTATMLAKASSEAPFSRKALDQPADFGLCAVVQAGLQPRFHELMVEGKGFFQRGYFAGFLDAAQTLDHAVGSLAVQAGSSRSKAAAGKGHADALIFQARCGCRNGAASR